ncbi:hypothetical protein N7520_009103 [Penicillium odoratum]|uniref:uncharacterized protein n=1 Tax=Penicillium odoratum TaxID=1167516 RepID=UPI0025499FF9|nr:uncharacterized protein N7520_009103 [Penicillium odoratum]KAJ5752186.1 hypothetical protein N7520_009103 [Penicillium odoratum]
MLNASFLTYSVYMTSIDEPDPAMVTLTSVLLETVHPTSVITEAVTVTVSPTAVHSDVSSLKNIQPEIVQSQQTPQTWPKIETTQSIVESPTTQPSTTSEEMASLITSSSSSSSFLQPLRSSHTSEVVVFSTNADTRTSVDDLTLISPSSSETPSLSSTRSSISIMSISPTFANMTPASTVASHLSTHLPTSTTMVSIFAGSSTPTKDTPTDKTNHRKVGAIVGGTVGAATFLALSFLALFLIRRKRRSNPHRRQNSRQGLLQSRDSTSSFRGHTRSISQPYFSGNDSSCIPSAPVFPAQRSQSMSNDRPAPMFGASIQSPYWEKAYFQGENHFVFTEDPLDQGPEKSPVSPIIEIFPPSRSASNYSKKSGHGDLGVPQFRPESYPNFHRTSSSRQTSSYRPGESNLTLPDTCSQGSKFNSPGSRDSVRSDPFDLEPPADILHKGAPVPSPQSFWSFRF